MHTNEDIEQPVFHIFGQYSWAMGIYSSVSETFIQKIWQIIQKFVQRRTNKINLFLNTPATPLIPGRLVSLLSSTVR